MARETGSVKWFSNEKGYGFIERQNGEDVFVHHSDIRGEGFRTLRQGETVEFEVIQEDRGPKALEVVRSEVQDAERRGVGSDRAATSGGSTSRRDGEQKEKSLAAQIRDKLGRRFLGFSR